jgi:hypothetical protein
MDELPAGDGSGNEVLSAQLIRKAKEQIVRMHTEGPFDMVTSFGNDHIIEMGQHQELGLEAELQDLLAEEAFRNG